MFWNRRKAESGSKLPQVRNRFRPGMEALESRLVPTADVSPVLMVLPSVDFYYQDYGDARTALESAGIEVQVAAPTLDAIRPHAGSGQGSDGGFVRPDLALADAEAEDYSAIVFVGGWGSSSYQYAFEGTYHNSAYNGDLQTRETVNDLIGDFVAQDKHVAAVCYGVSVLAWARVDGVSPLEGRTVAAYHGAAAGADMGDGSTGWHIRSNGANLLASGAVGDPTTSADDVVIDGKIITAENYDSAARFGQVVAEQVIAAQTTRDDPQGEAEVSPVLMVIANQDFYYREYSETRLALEAAGLLVEVAAGTLDVAVPHAGSGQGEDGGYVLPDLTLAQADAANYSAIVFVGGWGASSYQYAFEGTYHNSAYQGKAETQSIVNDLIGDFVAQDKYVAAICHGVSVLAYARVDGVSLLEGKTVASYAGFAPSADGVDGAFATTREHIESNGATMVASGSIGDPDTVADDVIVDGRIITAENYDSAFRFGEVVGSVLTS